MSQPIRVGLLRLVDSAPVVVSEASGLFRERGIDVRISIEPSWPNIADKLTYGVLDAAIMLPPLTLAAEAGLRGPTLRYWLASAGGHPHRDIETVVILPENVVEALA